METTLTYGPSTFNEVFPDKGFTTYSLNGYFPRVHHRSHVIEHCQKVFEGHVFCFRNGSAVAATM